MAEGKLKTVWEHHRENKIPYPENKPDWVEYAMWYQLCDTTNGYVKKAERASHPIERDSSYYMAVIYERIANRFLEGHIRAADRDAEQGMPPEAVAEMNSAGPDDPICVSKWWRDRSPSQSPLPEFCGKTPYSGWGDFRAELAYFGYELTRDHTDLAVIRLRMDRCLELWHRFPDDLSFVEMRERVILDYDRPWDWLRETDSETADEMAGVMVIVRRERSGRIHDGMTEIGRYMERRRKAKAAFLAGDWQEAMRLVINGHYRPTGW